MKAEMKNKTSGYQRCAERRQRGMKPRSGILKEKKEKLYAKA
jgi:hypothetical protein